MNGTEADLPVDDTALFNSTVSGEAMGDDSPADLTTTTDQNNAAAAATATTEQNAAPTEQRNEPAIPPARLREEADARRAAERERDEFKTRFERLEAQLRQQPPAQQQQQARPEFWDNPDEWGRSLVTPIQEQIIQQRQGMSRLLAEEKHGADTVKAAYQALGEALQSDPATQADYVRIMRSNHPYGELVAWHKKRQAFDEIGSDPAAYRNRVMDEALKDPTFLQRAIEAARGAAQPTVDATAVRRSAVPAIPSLQGIGTAASPAAAAGEQSDAELFSATTRRRR